MSKCLLVGVFVVGWSCVALASPHIYEKRYDGFTVWLDCQHHGAVAFFYELGKDEGSLSRSGGFKTDSSVPASCQPKNGKSYRTDMVNPETGTWDRGHLVPANHMDHKRTAMTDTFFVTNILPQQSTFNQSKGAWFKTEKISECYRDLSRLSIWGGMIWGQESSNDFFVTTHNVATPDFWWKLLYRHDTKAFVAWVFPNDKTAKASRLDDFLVTITELKARVDFAPDFGEIEEFPDQKPETSWAVTGSRTLKCEGISTSGG